MQSEKMTEEFEEFEDIFDKASTPPKDIPQPSRRTDAFAQRNTGGMKETVVDQATREEEEKSRAEVNLLEGQAFREARSKIKKENHGNFLVGLFRQGLPLTKEQINTIAELDLISEEELTGIKVVSADLKEGDKVPFDKDLLQNLSKDLKSKRVGFGNYQHCGREIEVSEWTPESVVSHKPDFVNWVNNMNDKGFQNKGHYEPLELYIQQAHNWLSENDNMENYHIYEDRWDYFEQEFSRCKENSLYFVEKYLYLKEADMEDAASMKYLAKPAHEVMLFLADCRYSLIIGKPRQIAATTTFLGFGLKKMMFNKNFFLKFVTMDVDTAEEIMEDKLKYPNSEIPDWLRAGVYGDSHEGLHFGRRIPGKKGKRGGANSKFSVVAPSVSAINAGAPPLVFVDEAGYIKVLGKMLRESRPTMFRQNQTTGELEMIRQVIIWSTGGVEEGKNKIKTKSFEEEVKHALAKWDEGSHDYGIVPIFFDWTTRPGITKEFYEQEKRNYSSGSDAEREQRMNQFRLTYPSCWDDMFLSEEKLIVPISFIQENERRINDSAASFKPQPGYFEPIVDRSQKANAGYSAHNDLGKIVGARFIPVDFDDGNASAWIFMHPEKGWLNRYYKGTDPIMTDTGYSNMASAIFDKQLGTVSAIVNYRNDDHKNTFLQTFLLGLYFNVDNAVNGVPELLEANIGTAYADFVEYMGYERTLVYKDELPDAFRGGGQLIGIDNKGKRAEFIIARLKEFISLYHKNLYFLSIFQQLRTFSCTLTASGAAVWSVTDKRRYKDDVLYAVVFAYICSLCYDNREPKKLAGVEEKYITTYDLVRGDDGLTRVPRRKKIY
jgi:hypothetical protein